jgi:DNA-binding MarR family transcriptional regulator
VGGLGDAENRASSEGNEDAVARWRRARPDLDPEVVVLYERLIRLSSHARRTLDATCRRHRLRHPEFEVLATLRSYGHPFARTPTELARTLLLSPAGMTDRIDRLCDRGWVERLPTPNDARSIRVALTDEGRRLVDAALTDHATSQSHRLRALTPTEHHTLDKLLDKLLASFER